MNNESGRRGRRSSGYRTAPYAPHENLRSQQEQERERRRSSVYPNPNVIESPRIFTNASLGISQPGLWLGSSLSRTLDLSQGVLTSLTAFQNSIAPYRNIVVDIYTFVRQTDVDDIRSKRNCTVCMETFRMREKLRTLPCTHIFHKRCIDAWFQKTLNCPICRYDIGSPLQKVFESFENLYTSAPQPVEASNNRSHFVNQTQEMEEAARNRAMELRCIGTFYHGSNPHLFNMNEDNNNARHANAMIFNRDESRVYGGNLLEVTTSNSSSRDRTSTSESKNPVSACGNEDRNRTLPPNRKNNSDQGPSQDGGNSSRSEQSNHSYGSKSTLTSNLTKSNDHKNSPRRDPPDQTTFYFPTPIGNCETFFEPRSDFNDSSENHMASLLHYPDSIEFNHDTFAPRAYSAFDSLTHANNTGFNSNQDDAIVGTFTPRFSLTSTKSSGESINSTSESDSGNRKGDWFVYNSHGQFIPSCERRSRSDANDVKTLTSRDPRTNAKTSTSFDCKSSRTHSSSDEKKVASYVEKISSISNTIDDKSSVVVTTKSENTQEDDDTSDDGDNTLVNDTEGGRDEAEGDRDEAEGDRDETDVDREETERDSDESEGDSDGTERNRDEASRNQEVNDFFYNFLSILNKKRPEPAAYLRAVRRFVLKYDIPDDDSDDS